MGRGKQDTRPGMVPGWTGRGRVVGILYAPKSGRETRDDLASGAREGTDYLRTRTRQAAEEVSALVDRSKEQVGEYVDRGREAVDRGRAQWEEFVERGKSLVTEQTGRVTAAVDAGRQAYKQLPVPATVRSVERGPCRTGMPSGAVLFRDPLRDPCAKGCSCCARQTPDRTLPHGLGGDLNKFQQARRSPARDDSDAQIG